MVDDKILYGQVEYIRSLISFEGEDVASLRASFEEAIDDYLALCEEKGIEPEKPFKGSFNGEHPNFSKILCSGSILLP